jgi:hypothetical protein
MHRVINRDGYAECFACGVIVEFTSDGDTAAAFRSVPCRPGGWDHPPYLMAVSDGCPPLFETCAAHPYAACEPAARYLAAHCREKEA